MSTVESIARPRRNGERRRAPTASISKESPAITGVVEMVRSEERFSRNAETDLVCRLLLEKKKNNLVPQPLETVFPHALRIYAQPQLAISPSPSLSPTSPSHPHPP